MSYIPAAVAVVMALIVYIYPLTTQRMKEIDAQLAATDRQNG